MMLAHKKHVHVLSATQSIYDRNNVQTTHNSDRTHAFWRESGLKGCSGARNLRQNLI